MSRTARNIGIEDWIWDRLEPLRSERALPHWLNGVLERHIADLDEAWMLLRSSGWEREHLLAACDALNGTWLHGLRPASYIALELLDADRLSQVADKWDAADWAGRVQQVREREEIAQALQLIVTDFWRRGPTSHRLG